jgi:hypothetical protein
LSKLSLFEIFFIRLTTSISNFTAMSIGFGILVRNRPSKMAKLSN